jgi:hypothetical protein
MIRGNVMDTYTIHFEDGDNFSLVAKDGTNAHWMASELVPGKKITRVERIGEWEDESA